MLRATRGPDVPFEGNKPKVVPPPGLNPADPAGSDRQDLHGGRRFPWL